MTVDASMKSSLDERNNGACRVGGSVVDTASMKSSLDERNNGTIERGFWRAGVGLQ